MCAILASGIRWLSQRFSGIRSLGQKPYGTGNRTASSLADWTRTGRNSGRYNPVYDSPNRRNGMSDQEPNRSEKRLQDIERRIAKMQGDRDDAAKPSRAALPVGMGAILSRVATELVAGVMVGAFMGCARPLARNITAVSGADVLPWSLGRDAECVADDVGTRHGHGLFRRAPAGCRC